MTEDSPAAGLSEPLQRARRRKDWDACLRLYGSHDRLSGLLSIISEIEDDGPTYWRLVSDVYQMADVIGPNIDVWEALFTKPIPGHEQMMSEAERVALAAMPERLTLYRGFDGNKPSLAAGWSWTLDHQRAGFFAEQSDSARIRWLTGTSSATLPAVAEGQASKSDVLAYLTDRDEQEIVINPNAVTNVNITYPKRTG